MHIRTMIGLPFAFGALMPACSNGPEDLGAEAESVVSTSACVTSIVANDSHVYWTDHTGLYQGPATGGSKEQLSATGGAGLHIDSTGLYWSTELYLPGQRWWIRWLPSQGGAEAELAARERGHDLNYTLFGIAMNSTHIFVALESMRGRESDRIVVVERKDPTQQTQYDIPVVYAVTADETGGYFATSQDIRRMTEEDSVVLSQARPNPLGADMVVDNTNVYWINESRNEVMKVAKAGGTAEVLARVPPGCGLGYHLAVDSGFVYFTGVWSQAAWNDDPSICEAAQDAVMKVPVTGGPVQVLSSRDSTGSPGQIAVDATHVYFSEGTNCSDATPSIIKRIPK